jgi:hypothetical protein
MTKLAYIFKLASLGQWVALKAHDHEDARSTPIGFNYFPNYFSNFQVFKEMLFLISWEKYFREMDAL